MTIGEKLQKIAENEQKVYDAGRVSGVEDGKQAAYDTFWDIYQVNGDRTDYSSAFMNKYWTDELFNPKYKIRPNVMNQCFYGANNITRDFTADMIDTSRCYNMYFAFQGLGSAHFPVIDMRAVTARTNARYPFYNCTKLQSIDGLYLPNVGVENPFHLCESLREVRILGDGKFLIDVDMSVCPLSRESIESVMAALSDDVTGQTLTLNGVAVDMAFSDGEGGGVASDEWTALVTSKPNWSIVLAE